MNSQDKHRLLSSLILISGVVVTIFLLPKWVSGFTVALFVAIALYEFFNLIEKKGIFIYKYSGIAIGVLIILSTYIEFEVTQGWELAFVVAACFLVFILQLTRKDSKEAITGISTTIFGIIYVAWLFSFVVKVRFMSQEAPSLPDGRWLVFFLILVTKIGDMGAYFTGRFCGRHALITRISPKKTVEGLIGGLSLSIIAAGASRYFLPSIPMVHLLILGVLLGGIGQVGDLIESLIKRDCDVKDTGNIIPGLGGVLDIIDSLLFTAPVLYFYLKALSL